MMLEMQIIKYTLTSGSTQYAIVLYKDNQDPPSYTFIADVHTNVHHMLREMWEIKEHWWVYDYAYENADYTFVASGKMTDTPRPTEVYLLAGHHSKSIYLCHNELKQWFTTVPGVISITRQDMFTLHAPEKEEDHES